MGEWGPEFGERVLEELSDTLIIKRRGNIVHCIEGGLMTSTTEAHTTYEQFKEEWLSDVLGGNPSSVEKGHRFAMKLVTQWLGITEDDDDFIVSDGPGDGGIDIAYLQRAENSGEDIASGDIEGDVWYLVQSKYGTSYQGTHTLFEEGRKVFETLAGTNKAHLAHASRDLVDRITQFRQRSSEHDRIVLVFATEDSLGSNERKALGDLLVLGNERFPNLIDVEAVSLQTLWEEASLGGAESITLKITADLAGSSERIKIGSVPIRALYGFLKDYESKTGNLDRLYEENVRQFLGSRKKVNQRMAETLEQKPEYFGLFNNGITVIAEQVSSPDGSSWNLTNPYVVNGCQTTRTIWNVLKKKLDSGGTGAAPDDWESRLDQGIVVAKLVQSTDAALIRDIVRFTNSQNAVRDQDFVALENDFRDWKHGFERDFKVFLEIRRGAWDAYKAQAKGRSDRFVEHANAFELIKVLGAGFHEMPGAAFRTNKPFLPGAEKFGTITEKDNFHRSFDHRNLYTAHLIKKQAERLGFGRGAKSSRRLTKFLFYMLTIKILREILKQNEHDQSTRGLVDALIKIDRHQDGGEQNNILDLIADLGARAIDSYMDDSVNNSQTNIYSEEAFISKNDRNLNRFLKWDDLGKPEETPNLTQVLNYQYYITSQPMMPGKPSLVNLVFEAIRA